MCTTAYHHHPMAPALSLGTLEKIVGQCHDNSDDILLFCHYVGGEIHNWPSNGKGMIMTFKMHNTLCTMRHCMYSYNLVTRSISFLACILCTTH